MEAVNGKNYMLTVSPEGEMINGQRMYEEGTEIQVSAISGEIFSFTSWEDGTTNATRTLTMNTNTTVTANFSNVPYIVGWDFYQSGRVNRPADMANETSNQACSPNDLPSSAQQRSLHTRCAGTGFAARGGSPEFCRAARRAGARGAVGLVARRHSDLRCNSASA